MKKLEKIIYFGSGPVAATSLKLLLSDFEIEAVITKPSTATEMKALVPGKPVHTVTTKQELSELFSSKPFKSRLGIVVDFGIIISKDVIDYFPLGIVNSHFSLLPEWRGADPITFAILSGQKQTGVSLMLINEALDEGKLLAQAPYHIHENATTASLTAELIQLSHALLVHTLPGYIAGDIKPYEQPQNANASYSRKLTKQDGLIDWHKSAEQLEREIRAFIDWPKSRTVFAGKEITITAAHVIDKSGKPGDVTVDAKQLVVFCGKQALAIDELKPAGKNKMTSKAFLAGYKNLL